MNMQLFEQGIDLVIEKLRVLGNRDDIRIRADLLHRIAALRTVETLPPHLATTLEKISAPGIVEQMADTPQHLSQVSSTGNTLDELKAIALKCTKCEHLARSRHSVVFGVGNPNAGLMFVGEAPGADEDIQGEPFVGRAGALLTKIIQTMGLQRSDVYIANVLKCRPDMPAGAFGNRQPTTEEMETCLPYLREQIELIKPKVIVALGGVAMRGLLGKTEPMKQLRGRWHSFDAIPVMATFHPSYLLRNQALSEKRKVWEDMLLVLERLEMPISERQRSYFLNK
jgi:DNA polymerase